MKKIIIPIIFALAGTSFVAYSFLDTYIIQKEYTGVFNANQGASNFSFSFANMGEKSSKSSSRNTQIQFVGKLHTGPPLP